MSVATPKPVVYLLPGLMCDATVWLHQRAALADQFDVRIPDFKGFTSLVGMAQAVLQTAPERFSVAGHSMGGRVAFELMQLAGKRIDHFAVLDSGVHPVKPGEPEKRQVLLDAAKEKGLQAVADAWILPMLHPDNANNQVLIKQITDMILRYTVEEFYGQVQALLGRSDQTANLAGIEQEVYLVCGEQDSWSPVSQHEAMQALLPRSRLRIVKGAGHMSTMEQPEAVSRLLLEWLHAE